MIRSMTSFGRVEVTSQWGHLIWEIRTVNHRYLEINPRLPEDLRGLDTKIRQRIQSKLKRGKVDCGLRFEPSQSENSEMLINYPLVEKILSATQSIEVKMCSANTFTALDVLRWPGVMEQQEIDVDSLSEEVLTLLDRTLEQVIETRHNEGQRIAVMIKERCEACQKIVISVRKHLPELIEAMRQKLQQRVNELCSEVDHDRLEQEIVILAQKYDVAEELDRLEAHINEVSDCLQSQQAVGRRLDFLMQEMNREANTLGSKAADLQFTNASVDLKVLIEQMREQIQNIE